MHLSDPQIQKALELINTFATGDTSNLSNLLAPDYIQHNLAYATGAEAFTQAVQYLASQDKPTTVNNIRAFVDGEFVFLHTIYNFAGGGDQVAFDVFRFADGLIAEHWDNLTPLAPPNPSGRTQTDGPVAPPALQYPPANKALIEALFNQVIIGGATDKMPQFFADGTYLQHNSNIADGLTGLNQAMTAMAEKGQTMVFKKLRLTLGQGNFVLTITEGDFATQACAYYDLFRLESGKIIEHWDVIQMIPPQNQWQNKNGKF